MQRRCTAWYGSTAQRSTTLHKKSVQGKLSSEKTRQDTIIRAAWRPNRAESGRCIEDACRRRHEGRVIDSTLYCAVLRRAALYGTVVAAAALRCAVRRSRMKKGGAINVRAYLSGS